MQKSTVDAKWSANTRGEIEYDYIKDPREYYQAHYKALYKLLFKCPRTNS